MGTDAPNEAGIIPRLCRELFERMEQQTTPDMLVKR